MKTKKAVKQLVLNKRTIVSLNPHFLGVIRGGIDQKENELLAIIIEQTDESCIQTNGTIVKNVTPCVDPIH